MDNCVYIIQNKVVDLTTQLSWIRLIIGVQVKKKCTPKFERDMQLIHTSRNIWTQSQIRLKRLRRLSKR